jgi:hypothetical protein
MTRWAKVLVLVGGVAAGCANPKQEETLADACQFSKCDCVSGFVILDTQPIQWQGDGRAGCPEGYRLRKLMVQ